MLPDDVASTIMMDGCWLAFSQRLRWPAPSTTATIITTTAGGTGNEGAAPAETDLQGKLAETQQLQRLPLTLDGLMQLDPELYRCSENTGKFIHYTTCTHSRTLAQLLYSNHSLIEPFYSTLLLNYPKSMPCLFQWRTLLSSCLCLRSCGRTDWLVVVIRFVVLILVA